MTAPTQTALAFATTVTLPASALRVSPIIECTLPDGRVVRGVSIPGPEIQRAPEPVRDLAELRRAFPPFGAAMRAAWRLLPFMVQR